MSSWPYILMYHSVSDVGADPYKVTVRPERLRRQLAWLEKRGLRGVSAAELIATTDVDARSRMVALTFDDGYADFVSEALPVLQHFGFTGSVYIVTSQIGGENVWDRPGPVKPLMTADEIRTVAAAGIEIGSHSHSHITLPSTSADTLAEQLRRSRDELTELVGADVRGFVYPFGDVGRREMEAVQAAGYDYACATRPRVAAGRFALPRTFICDSDSSWRLRAKWVRHRRLRDVTASAMAAP